MTPSALSTSAAPDFDDSARLPCLATGTPAPATMNAAQVEMLNEPEASPPVPTTSIASGGAFTPSILARMVVTAPVISSTVSPRTRSAISSAPICEGVASPDIMRSKADAASARVRLAPVATLAMSALKSSAMFELYPAACAGDLRAEAALGLRPRSAFQAAARSRKFFSIRWPCSEAMLSGWNCTPCTGKLSCIRPITR